MDPSQLPAAQTPTAQSPASQPPDPDLAMAADRLHNPPVVEVGSTAPPFNPAVPSLNVPVQFDNVEEPIPDEDPAIIETTLPENRKLSKKILAIFILLNLLMVSTVIAMWLKSSNTLKLIPYETGTYSLLVPQKYAQIKQESGYRFEEKDKNPATKSFVISISQPYPAEFPSEEEKTHYIELFKEQLPNFVKSFADNPDEKIENVTTERIIIEEKNAIRIKAALSDTKSSANFNMIIIFGNRGLYAVAVAAHEADSNLQVVTTDILNSLTVFD